MRLSEYTPEDFDVMTDDETFSCFVIVYEKRLNVQGSKDLIRGCLLTSMFRTAGNIWKDFVNMSIYSMLHVKHI